MNELKLDWKKGKYVPPRGSIEEDSFWMDMEKRNKAIEKQGLKEFIKEMERDEPDFVRDCRIRYLREQIAGLQVDIVVVAKEYERGFENNTPYEQRAVDWYLEDVPRKQKELSKLLWRLRFLEHPELQEGKITDEMIGAAKDFPIEELIEVNARGFALCPFHEEKTPSFYVKNGFGYCFGCGAIVDSVGLLMRRDGKTFSQAISFLTSAGNTKE